jgi:acyl-CoA hydrolase
VYSGFSKMVAVGDDRQPVGVPPLAPAAGDERRRHAAARVRKEMRVEMERRFKALQAEAGLADPPV